MTAAILFWFLPETRGLSWEEMDVLFGVVEEEERRRYVEMNVDEKMAEV